MKIVNKMFFLSLYAKRDYLPFCTLTMSYLCINMSSKNFYASLGLLLKFKASCAKIISTMIKQGGTKAERNNFSVKFMKQISKYLDYFHLHILDF